MASIFTYQEEPPRVHSPWSTPGSATPQKGQVETIQYTGNGSYTTSITSLEPERQDGPTEYKLHLLLRRSSSQSRQGRLQQLTTQLLWRLQQSSPFHSSSNASLVLPVLPEATPRLGVPDRPAKLLPGLEESQGALYEIGVADDGTLVGLVDEELEESLTNLRAMASSLGCVVDILRRVLVGQNAMQMLDPITRAATHAPKMWVAEVLVRPDAKSPRVYPSDKLSLPTALSDLDGDDDPPISVDKIQVEQLRVAVTGPSTAGKSSLVGTLTTSRLDNGRGKSRLSLLKHRHEIASGITSSVAQELVGYQGRTINHTTVINYASGDVSSWPDIHNLAERLVFLSDSPGLPRYAKSALRSLISWDPHWTLLCFACDGEDVAQLAAPTRNESSFLSNDSASRESTDASLAHLEMCLKLGLRFVVVVTKMDLATKTGLKTTLSRILSALKGAGKVPVLLSALSTATSSQDENIDVVSQLPEISTSEQAQLSSFLSKLESEDGPRCVPIVLTSSVTGAGFGKLHTLLKMLPRDLPSQQVLPHFNVMMTHAATFHVDEIFTIPPSRVYSATKIENSIDQGIVLCGHVAEGRLSVGDQLRLGPFWVEHDSTIGDDSDSSVRVASHSASHNRPMLRASSGVFSKSLQGEQIKVSGISLGVTAAFVDVYVVSLRSLRLPVRSMEKGETGTVGIQPMKLCSEIPLSRARKGMVLSSAPIDALYGYKSFTATFQASDFASMQSTPLILGGHAIAYVNSVRAAVKVTGVVLNDRAPSDPISSNELFSFDSEYDEGTRGEEEKKEIQVTFRFVSSVEWLMMESSVLIVPTMTTAGPISGPVSSSVAGLSGYVGVISEATT